MRQSTLRRGITASIAVTVLLFTHAVSAQHTVEELKQTVQDLSRQLEEAMRRLSDLEKQQKETAEAVAATPPTSPVATPERPPNALDVFWKDGLRLETPPNEEGVKPFALKISGRLQNDWFWGTSDSDLQEAPFDSVEDGVEFRRARIAIGGTIYEDFIFNTEYDFAADSEFKDVFLGMQGLPFAGTVRIGHYKEFGSLDELTSDNDTMFIERALPNVLVPSRNVGLGANNAFFDERMTVGVGVFRDTDDFGLGLGDDNYAFTGRVTGVPWRSGDGANVAHLGLWGSVRGTEDDDYRIRQRPEIHLAPRYLDTFDDIGEIDGMAMFGLEAGTTVGRFSAMAEYIVQSVDRVGMDNVMFSGGYAQIGVFLTDDRRPYTAEDGVFGKIRPRKNFQLGENGGAGAWELAMRYSILDLDDEDVDAGTQQDVTLGVNWFVNPNLRWSLNYVHAWVDRDNAIVFMDGTDDEETFAGIEGDFDGIVTRFQVTW